MSRRKQGKSDFRKYVFIIISLIAIVATCFTMFLGCEQDELLDTGDFSVHFINVGQGDCTLIKTAKGNMLIDAGDNGNESTILNYLEDQGITKLDYFIVTHSHADHIGGAAEVINGIAIDNIILSEYSDHDTKTYEKMIEAIIASDAKTIKAKPGAEYTMGDVKFTILSPFNDDNEVNNTSVTLKLTYGKNSFMFTGDAEKEVEQQLLEADYDLSADVYKLAHHGSSTSNTEEFIDAVNPEIAVICYGIGNDYGHPHKEIIDMLDDKNITNYSTAQNGTVIIISDGEKLTVETEK